MDKNNSIDEAQLFNEYSAVKAELANLFQKSGILSAISIFIISIIIEISSILTSNLDNNLYWLLNIFNIFPIISFLYSFLVLYPNLKKSPTSKYFIDFAECKDAKEICELISSNNVANQILINSKILVKKYKYYKISLIFSFPPISIFMVLYFNLKK